MADELQKQRVRLSELSAQFQQSQTTVLDLVNRRKQVDAQLTENDNVKHEFDKIVDTDGNNSGGGVSVRVPRIYKVSGPVLLQQDISEARSTVSRRLQLLGEERDRLETEMKKAVTNAQRLQQEIVSARGEIDALINAPPSAGAASQGSVAA